jgi:hypothetical protein
VIEDRVKAGVQGRKLTREVAGHDFAMAVEIAGAIEHPWYRCQALTIAASHVSDLAAARTVLNRALAAAHELDEPNRIVTVASWPLRALITRDLADQSAEVNRLLGIIQSEPHSLRRADALFSLLEAVFTNAPLRERVLSSLLSSLAVSHGWRAERIWGGTVLLMAGAGLEAARPILERMPEGKARRRAIRDLEKSEHFGPHWIDYFRG